MKLLIIYILFFNYLIAHGSISNNNQRFSGYLDSLWNFKNNPTIEHIGLSWQEKLFSDDLEIYLNLNHHRGSEWNGENLIEALYLDYIKKFHIGRIPHKFGYIDNFSNRPYILDRLMSQLFVDGFAMGHNFGNYKIYIYSGNNNIKFITGIDFNFYNFYINILAGILDKQDGLVNNLTENSHSHSHGSTGSECENLSGDEVCLNDNKNIYNIDIGYKNSYLNISTKLFVFDREGNGRDKNYLVEFSGKDYSLVNEIIYKIYNLDIAFRNENIWFKKDFYGNGSSEIAKKSLQIVWMLKRLILLQFYINLIRIF